MDKRAKILLYSSNMWFLGEGMLGPLFAVFTERIGGDIFDITWAWATYLIATGIFYILVGKTTDKYFNKTRTMVLGFTLNTLFTFSYLFVSSSWHLFIIQIGLGLASAMATPTWYALYAKYEDKKHDGLQWGLAGGEANIITGIAVIIGGFVVSYFSFTILFIIMGIIQSIATLYQIQLLRLRHT